MMDVKFDMCVKNHYMTKIMSQMTAANERGNYFTSIIGSTRRQNFMAGLSVERQGDVQSQQPQDLSEIPEDRRMSSFIQE
ncbi:MAG: hypothetical protein VZR09_09390 [Candidatus Gastranaerophilaceae bacterium]|jgi:hypothetical protein|nr:hypothetical protein [Candidatus Gastranaerophilaceae bacterium]